MKIKNSIFSLVNKVVNNNIMLILFTFFVLFMLSMIIISKTKADSSNNYDKSFVTIEIKADDTLSSIAHEYAISPEQYNDYIEEVKFINNLNNDTIHYGCYLLIPVYN